MLDQRTLSKVLKRIGGWIGSAILLAAIVLIIVYRPDRVPKVAAGLTAHNLCSAVFIAGLDPDATFRELVQPPAGGWARFIRYRLDRSGSSVTASFAGLVHATARFTDGYGCRLEYAENLPPPPPRPVSRLPTLDAFAPPTVVATMDPTIATAMDRVFSEHPKGPIKDVKAVVVVKDDQVIAERYAPGYGIDTPPLSYSVAKSFTNALLEAIAQPSARRS